jgi:hypothetical protein
MNMQMLMQMLQMLMGQPNLQQGFNQNSARGNQFSGMGPSWNPSQQPSGGMGGGLGRPVAGFDPQQHMQNAIRAEQQANTPRMQELMDEQRKRSAEARQQRGMSPYTQQFIVGVDDWASKQPGYVDANSFMPRGGQLGDYRYRGPTTPNQRGPAQVPSGSVGGQQYFGSNDPRAQQLGFGQVHPNQLAWHQAMSQRTETPDYSPDKTYPNRPGSMSTSNQTINPNDGFRTGGPDYGNYQSPMQMLQPGIAQNPFASLFMNQGQLPAFMGGQNTQMPLWGQGGPQNRQQPNLFSSFGFRR